MQTTRPPALLRSESEQRSRLDRAAVVGSGTAPYRLSVLLAAVTVLAASPTLLRPSLLSGPAVMIGSARGTALVLLVLTVPALLLSAHATAAGSARGLAVWLGALSHLTYQGLMFCFGTPFNSLFLLYVAMLGLSVWTAGLLLACTDVRAFASRWSPRAPARAIAGVLGVIASLNALLWLGRVVPTIGDDEPTAFLDGTGLPTNPVFIQDLALWLPLALVAAVLLWRRAPAGVLGSAVVLVLWTLEGVTVATDQWFGWRADPSTEWATTGAVRLFAVLTVVTAVPLWLHLRHVDGSD
jgi:hypothetical protein